MRGLRASVVHRLSTAGALRGCFLGGWDDRGGHGGEAARDQGFGSVEIRGPDPLRVGSLGPCVC